jgi:plastocyanin
MIRRAALAASLLLLFTVNAASAATTSVTIKDFSFNSATVTIGQGDTVSWSYPTGSSHHTSSSILPANVWSGMSWNFAFNAAGGGAQSQVFHEAGAWNYHCMIHGFMQGTVNVRFAASPANGALGTTFTLTLGDQALPSGFVHDIQKRKAGGAWNSWKSPTGSLQSWKPGKKGTFQFRTRVRHLSPSQFSGWSPVITVVVS